MTAGYDDGTVEIVKGIGELVGTLDDGTPHCCSVHNTMLQNISVLTQ